MSKHCPKEHCKPKCEPKYCRYDSWCDDKSSCDEVLEQVKTIVIKQHKFCQKERKCKEWGHSTRLDGCWEPVLKCAEKPRLGKHADQKHNKH